MTGLIEDCKKFYTSTCNIACQTVGHL